MKKKRRLESKFNSFASHLVMPPICYLIYSEYGGGGVGINCTQKCTHLGITARLIRKSKGCVMRGRIRDSFSSEFVSTSSSEQSQSQSQLFVNINDQLSQMGRNGSRQIPMPDADTEQLIQEPKKRNFICICQ
jgi:hypothetical protein